MIKYAKERKAFGKSIAEFGLIQRKIATAAARLYAAESMAYRTVGMIDAAWPSSAPSALTTPREIQKRIEEYAVECSILKVYGSEMISYLADEWVADHGRLRLCGRVPGGALLSRRAHQPHLRRHQRDQPADHYRLADEARHERTSFRC